MSKGSGGTRAGSSGNPRGGVTTTTINGWRMGEDSLGAPAVRAKGDDAADIYYALSSPVERAVESGLGDIRSGGGFSGPMDDREYTIIFRRGTRQSLIREYLEGMAEGAKLYARMNDRTLSEAEYRRAEAAFDKWIEKTYNG